MVILRFGEMFLDFARRDMANWFIVAILWKITTNFNPEMSPIHFGAIAVLFVFAVVIMPPEVASDGSHACRKPLKTTQNRASVILQHCDGLTNVPEHPC
jgi:hypothetical protein